MKITAHSNAGSTECNLKFATLTYSGSKLKIVSEYDQEISQS